MPTMRIRRRGERQEFVSIAPKVGFVGGYDGIRGIGIMMVMLEHSMATSYFNSFNGIVDVFFVISGFLITSLLLQEHRSTGRISLSKFYTRRALRLLPSLWLMLITVTVLTLAFSNDQKLIRGLPREIGSAFFYSYHLFNPIGWFLFNDTAGTNRTALITPMWSLSVEEQFYAVIAIAVIFVVRRNLINWSLVILSGIVVLAAWSMWNFHPGPAVIWFQRPDGLAVGVILAIINAKLPTEWFQRNRRWLLILGTVSLVVTTLVMLSGSLAVYKVTSQIVGVSSPPTPETYGWKPFYWPITPEEIGFPTKPFRPPSEEIMWWWRFGFFVSAMAVAPAVLCMARFPEWRFNRYLSIKPLRFLGRLSYTLYIWHYFFFKVIQAGMAGQSRVQMVVTEFVVAFAIALAVYYGVERPMLRVKLKFSSEREVVDLNTGKMVTVPGIVDPPEREHPTPAPTPDQTPPST